MNSRKKLFFPGVISLLLLIIVALFFIFIHHSTPITKRHATYFPPQTYKPDQLIIKYAPGKSPDEANTKIRQQEDAVDANLGILEKRQLFPFSNPPLSRYYLLIFAKGADIMKIENYYLQNDFIENTEPNFIVHASDIIPNDTYFSQQWGLSTIQMPKAWITTTGNPSIIIAIVDTGIDYNHPDLPKNILKGPNIPQGTNDPIDDNGHGTHVAGIIGALTNNGLGISGVNWNATIMAVKSLDGNGSGTETNIARGIQYAADNGAKIINLSLGAEVPCSRAIAFQDIINYASQKGSFIVAAAGNGYRDSGLAEDVSKVSPASCNGVIAVGATTQLDQRAPFSNFGTRVDISAPGVNILSTKAAQCNICRNVLGSNYVYENGTSMATPYVSGVASLILSLNPGLSSAQVKNCLISGADKISTDLPIGPRLNAYNALQSCSLLPTYSLPAQLTITPTLLPAQSYNTNSGPKQNPQPTLTFDCSPDKSCLRKNTLQLCPLICKPK